MRAIASNRTSQIFKPAAAKGNNKQPCVEGGVLANSNVQKVTGALTHVATWLFYPGTGREAACLNRIPPLRPRWRMPAFGWCRTEDCHCRGAAALEAGVLGDSVRNRSAARCWRQWSATTDLPPLWWAAVRSREVEPAEWKWRCVTDPGIEDRTAQNEGVVYVQYTRARSRCHPRTQCGDWRKMAICPML